jgi:hypothetical protein
MPIRLGPLGLSPTVTVTNFGVDSNLFNDSADPKSDVTITTTPRLLARLRASRMLLTGSVASGLVYYQEFDDQRSIDYATDGRVDVDLGWFRPYASAALLDTRERLNVELDARAPRTQTRLAAGGRAVLSDKIGFVFDARRSSTDFAEGSTFEGVPLSRMLNSTTDVVGGGLEVYATPLTTISLTASRQQDRFDESPNRDANSLKILPGIRMEAPAIVQGSLAIGYRQFEPLSADIPEYSGVIAEGSLTHTLGERTRIDFGVLRDVEYSFEVTEPYYLTTGVRLTLTQFVGETVEVRLTGRRDRLEYRTEGTAVPDTMADRTDRVDAVGGGVGYRLRPNLRIGFDVEVARRLSDRPERRYERTRLFASLSYGL